MFIKRLTIQNFRLFSSDKQFVLEGINVPDQQNEGSGITVFVGENGCGKTSLLDAISLPFLEYKTENFSVDDFYNPTEKTLIELFAEENFEVDRTMPRGSFKAQGILFEAGFRARENRAYLSSTIVSDQKFIKPAGQSKPEDSSPDLRVNVNNPFKGRRFNENDILFLDKNRIYQTRLGTYNPTRFDKLMEDFNYQFVKQSETIKDINANLSEAMNSIDNDFLGKAIEKFKDISGSQITLNLINNWKPFSKGFFAENKQNNQQIILNKIGSGYEMIFSLLYSFYLSQQSGKQLIVLIDEPELHLHPSLQENFVKVLLEFSKDAQIILTSQSPLFIKQLLFSFPSFFFLLYPVTSALFNILFPVTSKNNIKAEA